MNRNILVTSAGRRVSFVRGFQQVTTDERLLVFAADANPGESAACQISDGGHPLPHVSEPDFVDALLHLCQSLSVGLVVPTIDTELPILAAARRRFAELDIHIAISDLELIEACADKRQTAALFDGVGVCRPEIYAWPNVPHFPIFSKPVNGSASIGIALLNNAAEVEAALESRDQLMLCEYIDPATHDEFTIDCYYDRSSVLRCAVPRQRIEVRGGEVAKARTCKNELVAELFDCMNHLPGARGIITVQAFVDRQRRTTSFIEINARVGGGYPLSRIAGADFQQLLVDEYLFDTAPETIHGWRDHALMLRYDAEVVRFDV